MSKTRRFLDLLQQPVTAWAAILAIWAVWMLQPFHQIGMTTSDQVQFSLSGFSNILPEAWEHAKSQGRVYFLLTKSIDFVMAARPETFATQLTNLLAYSLSPLFLAIALFTQNSHRALFVWLFLCTGWIAYHHMPPAAYPLVNHMAFPLWALIAWFIRKSSLKTIHPLTLLVFFLLSFAALFQYEPITVMSIVIISWILVFTKMPIQTRRSLSITFAAAVIVYGTLFLAWNTLHPTRYDGRTLGDTSIFSILDVAIAYTLGALPFIDRDIPFVYLQWGETATGRTQLFHFLNEQIHFRYLEILIALAGAAASFLLLNRLFAKTYPNDGIGVARTSIQTSDGRQSFIHRSLASWKSRPAEPFTPKNDQYGQGQWLAFLALGIALAVAPNILLGLSVKYQAWVNRWPETYLTSQLSLYGWCVLAVVGASWINVRLRSKRIPLGLILVIVASAAIAAPVREQNEQFGIRQRSLLARWEALDALAQSRDHWTADTLVAPQLYFDAYTNTPSWSRHWETYSKLRYDLDLTFLSSLPEFGEDPPATALMLMSLSDDGYLQAISLQTGSATHVIAKPEHAPVALVSNTTGAAVSLDWRESKPCGNSDYRIITIQDGQNPTLVGLHHDIEPIWTLPRLLRAITP